MILNDSQIAELARNGMIEPFTPHLVKKAKRIPVLSYGLGGYGYDLRLSPKEFRIFHRVPGAVVDPKAFREQTLESVPLHEDSAGRYFILPGRSYGLGVAMERLCLPRDISAVCLGKSTYARCGIIANVTPAEAGWRGFLTLEFSNSSAADCRIYAKEGVVQLLFFRGRPCQVPYGKRKGKYQGQTARVTFARA